MKHWEKIIELRGLLHVPKLSVYASSVCFYLVLSMVPAASLLLTGVSCLSNRNSLTKYLHLFIPSQFSGIAEAIISELSLAPPYRLISVSGLLALWSAAKSIQAIRLGLNLVMEIHEEQNFFGGRVRAVLTLIPLMMILPVGIVLSSIGAELFKFMQVMFPRLEGLLQTMQMHGDLYMFAVMGIAFTAVYRIIPTVSHPIGSCFLVGVIVSLLWQCLSVVFSFYIRFISNYETIYGTLGLITLGLIWMQFSVILFLYGGRCVHILNGGSCRPLRLIRRFFSD